MPNIVQIMLQCGIQLLNNYINASLG